MKSVAVTSEGLEDCERSGVCDGETHGNEREGKTCKTSAKGSERVGYDFNGAVKAGKTVVDTESKTEIKTGDRISTTNAKKKSDSRGARASDTEEAAAEKSDVVPMCYGAPTGGKGGMASRAKQSTHDADEPVYIEEVLSRCTREEELQPPDGGWGWLVVFGSFIITMLVPLLGPCFGVLFSRYLLAEGSSSATTAWIFNTQCFMWNMMGLLVRPLSTQFGWRRVAILAVLLTTVSVIMSAFSPSPEFLFFSFSLLSGMGGGTVVIMCFIIVPMYFDRRRGFANAMMMAGVCIGQILGPPFVRLLQDEYGFRGATLILGSIMMNGCVGASFFHPVEWHMKKSRQDKCMMLQEGEVPLIPVVTVDVDGDDLDKMKFDGDDMSMSKLTMREDDAQYLTESSYVKPLDSLTQSLTSLSASGILPVPVPDTENRSYGYGQDSLVQSGKQGYVGMGGLLLTVARSTIADLGIFRSPRAVIISFGCTFFINGYYNFIMMVPFAMQAQGHTLEDAAWCISVFAVCNLLSRVVMSSLSDWPKFNMRAAYMAGLATTASATLVFPLLSEVTGLMGVMAVYGLGVGTTMGLYNLVMVRFMGLHNLAPVIGASSLTVGVGHLCIGPLIGVIRDVSGSYSISMWALSGVVFTSFLLWMFMPAAQAYDQRKSVT